MSKNDKNKNNKDFREEILDKFPEDMLPGYKPEESDPLTSSFSDLVNASGVRTLLDKMCKDPRQRQAMGVFLDSLVEKDSPHFEQMRETLKNPSIRRKLLLEMAKATGKGPTPYKGKNVK